MAATDDIKRIIEQEKAVAFNAFDEEAAFQLGCRLRKSALDDALPIVIDIRLWDRPLFYAILPGATASNADWARRKTNTVRHFQKASYRLFLETGDQVVAARHGLSPSDFVFAGGGFPLRVKSAGVIGAIAISGLPSRQDHNVVVAALAEQLGLDPASLALGPES